MLRAFPWLGGTETTLATQFETEDLSDHRLEVDPSRRVWLEEITLRNVDFSGVQFGTRSGDGGLTVHACVFEDCDFREAVFHVADLGWQTFSVYRRCAFDRSKLRQILGRSPLSMAFQLGEARFEECTFFDAEIRGWLAHEAEFVDCRFRGTIDGCRFFGRAVDRKWLRPRKRNEYRGNDFREVEFSGVRFEDGIPIGKQLWPESDDYVRLDRVRERIRAVTAQIENWEDDERREAELVLKWIGELRQAEIFDRRVEPGLDPAKAAVHHRVWRLLEVALD